MCFPLNVDFFVMCEALSSKDRVSFFLKKNHFLFAYMVRVSYLYIIIIHNTKTHTIMSYEIKNSIETIYRKILPTHEFLNENEIKESKDRICGVYLAELKDSEGNIYHKIGVTSDVKKRMKHLLRDLKDQSIVDAKPLFLLTFDYRYSRKNYDRVWRSKSKTYTIPCNDAYVFETEMKKLYVGFTVKNERPLKTEIFERLNDNDIESIKNRFMEKKRSIFKNIISNVPLDTLYEKLNKLYSEAGLA